MRGAPLLSKVRSRVGRALRRSSRFRAARNAAHAAARPAARDTARISALERQVPAGGVGAEIGVHKGDFTERLLTQLQPVRLHLLDPWYLIGPEWNWGLPDRSTINALCGILKRYSNELVRGQVVLDIGWDEQVLATFPDATFDWVYLDTIHKFHHTRNELRVLARKVKPGGIIAGDDWYLDPSHLHHGVCRAVRLFLDQEPYELLYASDDDHQWLIRRAPPSP